MKAAPSGVYTDPMISCGPFRVLPRVDGAFLVVDNRRPAGLQTVAVISPVEYLGQLPDAVTAAKAAAKEECERRGAAVADGAAA